MSRPMSVCLLVLCLGLVPLPAAALPGPVPVPIDLAALCEEVPAFASAACDEVPVIPEQTIEDGETRTYDNGTFLLTGNVSIQDGGGLVFDNATVLFTEPDMFILAESGALLTIVAAEIAPFDENDPGRLYVWANPASEVAIVDSTFHRTDIDLYMPSPGVVTGNTFTGAQSALITNGPMLVAGNTFRDNDYGLALYGCDGCVVLANEFYDNDECMFFAWSPDLEIGLSYFEGCGTGLFGWDDGLHVHDLTFADGSTCLDILDGDAFPAAPAPLFERLSFTDCETSLILYSLIGAELHTIDVSGGNDCLTSSWSTGLHVHNSTFAGCTGLDLYHADDTKYSDIAIDGSGHCLYALDIAGLDLRDIDFGACFVGLTLIDAGDVATTGLTFTDCATGLETWTSSDLEFVGSDFHRCDYGAVITDSTSVSFDTSSFTDKSDPWSQGLRIVSSGSIATVHVEDSTFQDWGQGIHVGQNSSLSTSGLTFIGNDEDIHYA